MGVAAQVHVGGSRWDGCEREGLSLCGDTLPPGGGTGRGGSPSQAVPALTLPSLKAPQARPTPGPLSSQPRPLPVGSPGTSRLQCPFMTTVRE